MSVFTSAKHSLGRSRVSSDEIREARNQPYQVVYLIGDGAGHVKIGKSSQVMERLAALQIGTPHKLELLGVIDADEGAIHERFAKYHVRGEWYHLGARIKFFIKTECFTP